MSCTHHTALRPSDFTAGLRHSFNALYCAVRRSIEDRLERRRLLAELQSLDRRELRDLHLQRGDFDRIVRHRRRRPF